MKFKTIIISLFFLILSFAFSKTNDEKNVTVIVTGNVRSEFNLCG